MTAAAGIVIDLSLLHALQPEQLIARLPPEYYVVLPEVDADEFASTVTLSNALEHGQVARCWTSAACCRLCCGGSCAMPVS
jgi:hypothetical protein